MRYGMNDGISNPGPADEANSSRCGRPDLIIIRPKTLPKSYILLYEGHQQDDYSVGADVYQFVPWPSSDVYSILSLKHYLFNELIFCRNLPDWADLDQTWLLYTRNKVIMDGFDDFDLSRGQVWSFHLLDWFWAWFLPATVACRLRQKLRNFDR